MRAIFFALVPVLIAAGLLTAGEEDDSVLARLDRETRSITRRLDGAVVRFSGGHGVGVLVGNPPRLVSTFLSSRKQVGFLFPDGTKGTATLWDQDEDLGLAVFQVPQKTVEGRRGLEPATRDGVRGSLGVTTTTAPREVDRALRLVAVRGQDALTGRLRIDLRAGGLPAGAPLAGAGGKLLGLRTAQVSQFCSACHAEGGVYAGNLRMPAGRPHAHLKGNLAETIRLGFTDSFFDRIHAGGSASHVQGTSEFVPASTVRRVLEDLESHGRIRRPYLGVILGTTRGTGKNTGVAVGAVLAGSPAAKAGLHRGQTITALDGKACHDPLLLGRALALRRPGDDVRLRVAGKEEEITIRLGDRNAAVSDMLKPGDVGLDCVSLSAELREFFGLDESVRGVMVRSVRGASPAARAGIRKGHVIVSAEGKALRDLGELEAALAAARESVELELSSGGRSWKARIQLGKDRLREKAR